MKQTGCDSLAAAIGTSHGACKFKDRQSLCFEVIEAIQKKLPGTPIIIHTAPVCPRKRCAGSTRPAASSIRAPSILPPKYN